MIGLGHAPRTPARIVSGNSLAKIPIILALLLCVCGRFVEYDKGDLDKKAQACISAGLKIKIVHVSFTNSDYFDIVCSTGMAEEYGK